MAIIHDISNIFTGKEECPKAKEPLRMHLELDPQAAYAFQKMQRELGNPESVKIIIDALRYYHYFMDKMKSGNNIFVGNPPCIAEIDFGEDSTLGRYQIEQKRIKR